jgi:hypothetical protein
MMTRAQLDATFDRLIEELKRLVPEGAEFAEAEGREYIEELGSVEDVFLYLEWVDRDAALSPGDEKATERLIDEISRRAKSETVIEMIRGMQSCIDFKVTSMAE